MQTSGMAVQPSMKEKGKFICGSTGAAKEMGQKPCLLSALERET